MPYLFYLDDILVASASTEDHLTHLPQLFERLSKHDLIINPAKCEFGRLSITFLGHHFTPVGGRPPPCQGGHHHQFLTSPHREVPAGVLGHAEFLQPFPSLRSPPDAALVVALQARGPRTRWTGHRRGLMLSTWPRPHWPTLLYWHIHLPLPWSPSLQTTLWGQCVSSGWVELASCWPFSAESFDREFLFFFAASTRKHFRFLLRAFADQKLQSLAMAKTSEP